jgi:carboxyl-terminal processing protease
MKEADHRRHLRHGRGPGSHSQYFDKKSYKEFREGTSGRFVGVGIEIGMEDGLVKIVSRSKARPPSAPA